MNAKIYYQDFTVNGLALNSENLIVNPEKSTFIKEITEKECREFLTYVESMPMDKFTFANTVWQMMNSLDVPEGHKDRPIFEKAGHTSMSIGDYIEFEDGEILIASAVGWQRRLRKDVGRVPCSHPMSIFYQYEDEIPEGTRISTPEDCEECEEEECEQGYCLIFNFPEK